MQYRCVNIGMTIHHDCHKFILVLFIVDIYMYVCVRLQTWGVQVRCGWSGGGWSGVTCVCSEVRCGWSEGSYIEGGMVAPHEESNLTPIANTQ